MTQKILEIKKIQISILKSNPPKLGIVVFGIVPTSGWTNPKLSGYMYYVPPQDGIYDFDFIVDDDPFGITLPVITPIMASITFEKDLTEIKGVRIHASSNTLVKMLNDPEITNINF